MTRLQDVVVPDYGTADGVNVAEVMVGPGDDVAVDDSLVVLESDKASMEVPSPLAGRVAEIFLAVGDVVQIGTRILTIEPAPEATAAGGEDPESDAQEPTPPAPEPPAKIVPPPSVVRSPAPAQEPVEREPAGAPARSTLPHASPGVRRVARELGVDLERVNGTGRKGRITKEDVQAFVKSALARGATDGGGDFQWPLIPKIDFAEFGPIEVHPLGRIRRAAAASVHRSWLHVPHVTQLDEADITELDVFRRGHADEAERRGFKLTLLAFVMRATAHALTAFPDFNSSLAPDGESLIRKKYHHLGVAVDTPEGLVVPVVRDVDQKGIFQLAEELADTSDRARAGKLMPADFQGGCFTISSLGGIGGTAFTPIVNSPEVAILGVSRAQTKGLWIEGELVPRLMLPLCLSYDHRVIDGAGAARFIVHLGGLLADLRIMLL